MTADRDAPEGPPRPDPAGGLIRRSLATLAAVAALLLLNQILVQPPLLELSTDAPLINIAGRQRMLSQRITKAALAIDRPGGRERYAKELDEALANWTEAHERLRRGRWQAPPSERNRPELRAAFDDLQPYFESLRAAARRIAAGPPTDPRTLADLLDTEGEYLARMDRIVGMYERETRAHVDRLRATGWLVTGAILVALLGIGRFILLPASRLIQRQFGELSRSRDTLEGRVRERTHELEAAYEKLAIEVGERLVAQGRHRELLEQFGHISRTNTLGEMASGLAHELNQPLGAIANYAEGCLVLLESPEPDLPEVKAALGKLLAATLRAGQVLRGVRRFVTRHDAAREPYDPNRVVEEVMEFLRDEAARRGVLLQLELAPDLPSLQGDPVQIQQVIVNLVRNALEAVRNAESPDPSVVVKTRNLPEGGAEILVIDNGEGIPEGRDGTIFDAFFSTRAEGMGMGLAISRRIVEAHEGRIAVESTPGVRTTFRVTLPRSGGDDAATDRVHRR